MNYNEFLEQKKQILNNNNVIDMSENNLYKFMTNFFGENGRFCP